MLGTRDHRKNNKTIDDNQYSLGNHSPPASSLLSYNKQSWQGALSIQSGCSGRKTRVVTEKSSECVMHQDLNGRWNSWQCLSCDTDTNIEIYEFGIKGRLAVEEVIKRSDCLGVKILR